MYFHDNDYELLYLIKENHEEALDVLYRKYSNLIKSRIKAFRIKSKNYDDFYQEGLMALEKAIQTFDDKYNKSFTRYFDLILQRKFIQILKKEQKHFYNTIYVEDFYEIVEEYTVQYNIECDEKVNEVCEMLSDFEKEVFQKRIKLGLSSAETAKILDCSIRQVYNAMLRIRQKAK